MAFRRDSAGAIALGSHPLQRRRRASRRNPRRPRAISETTSPQAIIIGPGGTTDLQPVFAGGQGVSDIQSDDQSYPDHGISQSNSPQPVPTHPRPAPLPIAPPLSAIMGSSVSRATPIASANQAQVGVAQPSTLVAAPRPPNASTRLSLVTNVITQSTFAGPSHTGSLQVVETTASTVIPSASSTGAASDSSVPISQSPPIIFAIILASVLAIAAISAVVSWVLRAQRRRYNNRLADLGLEGNSLENAFNEPTVHRDTDMERGYLNPPPPRPHAPEYPVYVEPQEGAHDQDMYSSETQLHYHSPRQNDPYYPALQVTNLATGDLSMDSHTSPYLATRGPATRKQTERGHQIQDSNAPWSKYEDSSQADQLAVTSGTTSFRNINNVTTSQYQQADRTSWNFGLPTRLTSALDAVKQAAGDRMFSVAPWSMKFANQIQDQDPSSDRFTPLALRPGRKSLSGIPVRRGTKEAQDLAFGGVPSNDPGDMRVVNGIGRQNSKHGSSARNVRSSRIHGLGTFSFEGGPRTPSQGGRQFGIRKKSALATHSERLGRHDSAGASNSSATSRSGSGSGSGHHGSTEGRMRKRKSRQAAAY